MKTLIQKLPLKQNRSFIARTFETPYFETPYHQHNEYELMVIKKGNGTAFIGDYIGDYQVGDVYLHGKSLPHWFRKKEEKMIGASMVVQFKDDFLGNGFFDVPEMKAIRKLLDDSSRSIYCKGELKKRIRKQLLEMEDLNGFEKIISLLTMLHEISLSDEYEYVSGAVITHSEKDQLLVNKVFEFSMNNFKRKIKLEEVAGLCNKSTSAFSHYFKKVTKTSYINFLKQIRISHACELLKSTNLSITEICFESGFNNWANFSKHFKEHCKISPSQYRASLTPKKN
ncbi:AraC family transcriptional regulator [Prolixibacteraceae bacterium Z1-6]|uniref:AraC family transcriptional regulator n=1 Tax=Draconibacterium aestuarii TaxID=2998507 RepID=A0A9X3F330_9BACT|nr:AraC family transcriptional regulator [Prolixibacteraceae bacterium Z1-6]